MNLAMDWMESRIRSIGVVRVVASMVAAVGVLAAAAAGKPGLLKAALTGKPEELVKAPLLGDANAPSNAELANQAGRLADKHHELEMQLAVVKAEVSNLQKESNGTVRRDVADMKSTLSSLVGVAVGATTACALVMVWPARPP